MKPNKTQAIFFITLATCWICSCLSFVSREEVKAFSFCFDLNSQCFTYKDDISTWDSCDENQGFDTTPTFIQEIYPSFKHTLKTPRASYLVTLFTHSIFFTHEIDLTVFDSPPLNHVLIAPNNTESINFSTINKFGSSVYWVKENPSIHIEGLEFFSDFNFCFLVEENFLIKSPLLNTIN